MCVVQSARTGRFRYFSLQCNNFPELFPLGSSRRVHKQIRFCSAAQKYCHLDLSGTAFENSTNHKVLGVERW